MGEWYEPKKLMKIYEKEQPFKTAMKNPRIRLKIRDLLSDFKGKSILEIGPGTSPLFEGRNVVFVDISRELLKNITQGKKIIADLSHPPFREPGFDLIVLNEVLCLVRPEYRGEVLDQIAKLSSKEGSILITERHPDYHKSVNEYVPKIREWIKNQEVYNEKQIITRSFLLEQLESRPEPPELLDPSFIKKRLSREGFASELHKFIIRGRENFLLTVFEKQDEIPRKRKGPPAQEFPYYALIAKRKK